MKKNYSAFLSSYLYAPVALMLTMLISACGKDAGTTVNQGALSVYNFSPTGATYDAYLNNGTTDSKVNTSNLPFGGGIKYLQINAGTYGLKFKVATELTEVFNKTGVEVTSGGSSTVYLVGTAPNFETVQVNDSYVGNSNEKAYVRFINLAADAPALSLALKKETNLILAVSRAYKQNSEFTPVDAAAAIFEITDTANGTVLATTTATTLAAGGFYTIAAGGKLTKANSNEIDFTAKVIKHQ